MKIMKKKAHVTSCLLWYGGLKIKAKETVVHTTKSERTVALLTGVVSLFYHYSKLSKTGSIHNKKTKECHHDSIIEHSYLIQLSLAFLDNYISTWKVFQRRTKKVTNKNME